MLKFYKLVGYGPLIEISEGEYQWILDMAMKSEFHEDLKKPYTGVQYRGIGYLCLAALQ